MLDIKQNLVPVGRRNRPGHNLNVRYITIHNTPSTSAKGLAIYCQSAESANTPKSWHFNVDDHEIWQSMPTNEVAWHAGDGYGPGNMSSIGVEICHMTDATAFRNAVGLAAGLTAQLLHEFRLPLGTVKQHHDWSGKDCPKYLRAGEAGGWDGFLHLVEVAYTADSQIAAYFEPTQCWIHEEYYQFWRDTGALPGHGMPIAPATGDPTICQQYGPDVVMVQYFERSRLEKHVDADGQATIMLGRVGAELLDARGY